VPTGATGAAPFFGRDETAMKRLSSRLSTDEIVPAEAVEWESSVLAGFVPTEVLEQAAAVADEVVATETVENGGNSFDRRAVNGGQFTRTATALCQ
jgi:hypothetical protein